MILTEAEARSRRCTPALIIKLIPAEQLNAQQARDENVSGNCIGSACMQWCFFDYQDGEGQTWRETKPGTDPLLFNLHHRGRSMQTDSKFVRVPARGYCGLTGSRE